MMNYMNLKTINKDVQKLNRLLLNIKWQESSLETLKPELTDKQKEFIDVILLLIPEWKRLIGCQQHKTHDYTLDIHTLLVIARIINSKEFQQLDEYYKLVLLYSALLHDIAKEALIIDPTHPTKSSVIASEILYRLGFDKDFVKDTTAVIKRHQYLGLHAANKLCINIPEFANFFNKDDLIDILAILALADIKSVKKDEEFINQDIKNNLEHIRYNIKRYLKEHNCP